MKLTKNILVDLYLARNVVVSGPFHGTYLRSHSSWAGRPKWLGTYEKELWSTWQRVFALSPRTIFDIGGGEGYYGCGLLRALPSATLDVWEILPLERDLIRYNATRNRVASRCSIHGRCEPAALAAAVSRKKPDLVVCDIEGGEQELFTAAMLAELATSILIVETHGQEIFEKLLDLISATHDVEAIHPQPRTRQEWPLPWYLYATETLKYWGIQEPRLIPTPWLVGWPRPSIRRNPT